MIESLLLSALNYSFLFSCDTVQLPMDRNSERSILAEFSALKSNTSPRLEIKHFLLVPSGVIANRKIGEQQSLIATSV